MENVYAHIATRLVQYKDVARFGSLSTITHAAVYTDPGRRWSLSIIQRTLDRGVHGWIQRYGSSVRGLCYKNCVFSPTFELPSSLRQTLERLEFMCCRISLQTLHSAPPGLRILKLHQLMPGDDPGCVTHVLRSFLHLEVLDITFHRGWGLSSLGPFVLPHLKALHIRSPSHLLIHGDVPAGIETIVLEAETLELVGERPLPTSCRTVCLKSREAFLNPHDLFPSDRHYPQLTHLHFETMGLLFPTFLEHIPHLQSFLCRCDSFVVTRPLGRLLHLNVLHIAVKLCFVCDTTIELDVRRLRDSCDIRTTVDEEVFDILTLFS